MKIGIISDTHMNNKYIDKALKDLSQCDLIIHAGDNFVDSQYIHQMTKVGIIAVKGNCDFQNVEREIEIDIENKKIFICHGDRYDVKYGIELLEKKAKEIKADIVVFGHTHTSLNKVKDGILYLNPGSISLPRGDDFRGFFVLNIENNNIYVEQVKIK